MSRDWASDTSQDLSIESGLASFHQDTVASTVSSSSSVPLRDLPCMVQVSVSSEGAGVDIKDVADARRVLSEENHSGDSAAGTQDSGKVSLADVAVEDAAAAVAQQPYEST